MTVERADIPLETYWSDRTAALAEALQELIFDLPIGEDVTYSRGYSAGIHTVRDPSVAKDVLLYLREHGWTLERSGD